MQVERAEVYSFELTGFDGVYFVEAEDVIEATNRIVLLWNASTRGSTIKIADIKCVRRMYGYLLKEIL